MQQHQVSQLLSIRPVAQLPAGTAHMYVTYPSEEAGVRAAVMEAKANLQITQKLAQQQQGMFTSLYQDTTCMQ